MSRKRPATSLAVENKPKRTRTGGAVVTNTSQIIVPVEQKHKTLETSSDRRRSPIAQEQVRNTGSTSQALDPDDSITDGQSARTRPRSGKNTSKHYNDTPRRSTRSQLGTKKQTATARQETTDSDTTISSATKFKDVSNNMSVKPSARTKAAGSLSNKPSTVRLTQEISKLSSTEDEKVGAGENRLQYWLMKAEPNDRYENGINVKFSIDDLAAAVEPEPWDGVRNYAARNNMRAMRKNDFGFFYHSNCSVPGVVGILQIVREHSIDESAFDTKHPYYDEKSTRQNPKWDVVHVKFVKKFDTQVTLRMINDNAASSGELANMQLVKQKRLSVTKVSPSEWQFILGMAGEPWNLEEFAKR